MKIPHMTKKLTLDKYARNAPEWRDAGFHNYRASIALFESGDPFLWLTAAVLGHHALEMLLKAILIQEGMTVFDKASVKDLDPALGLKKTDCAWGHNLVELARKVEGKRTDFKLSAQIPWSDVGEETPISVLKGFEIFEAFFWELRYPRGLQNVSELGDFHGELLRCLYEYLEPFLAEIPPPTDLGEFLPVPARA